MSTQWKFQRSIGEECNVAFVVRMEDFFRVMEGKWKVMKVV